MSEAAPTITVTGHGLACRPADAATIRMACQAERTTVADAVADANASVRLVRAALAEHGVDIERSSTAAVEIRAVERRNRDGEPSITGYSTVHRLTIEVEELQRLGQLLSAAVAAAGDSARLEGVALSASDTAALAASARDDAWADAVHSATQLAEHAARRLGNVVRIVEGAGAAPAPTVRMAAAMPVEPGGVEERASVTVTWELV